MAYLTCVGIHGLVLLKKKKKKKCGWYWTRARGASVRFRRVALGAVSKVIKPQFV